MGPVHGTNRRYEEASTVPRIHRCRGSSAIIWKLGIPPSPPMAEMGGVVTSQPQSQPESINEILTDNTNGQLHALENAPGGQAVSNDYVPPPNQKDVISNNNLGQPLSDYMLVPGLNPAQQQRTSLIIVTDHQQGKTKVLKVVKRETSRTSRSSTTPFQVPCSKDPDICPYCEQCRCPKCKLADEPAGKLILNRRCLCTPKSVLDTSTCFCCVRGIFYHCLANDNDVDENTFVDEPCSCHHKKCCVRWSTIGVMSLLFPCLLCYLPGRACIWGCRKCSTRRETGCKCKRTNFNGML
ncbi:protein sprouty homolog 1-like isoform X2 [Anneissia japonica]|uniref:protein sprouty homolog 1-like isoform X2 n=1 Tax=Anneissia japonica TaxID=1529436 RepID=UPI001425B46F|nr:protein sprouty homolog 1-like isoform X2 [Anneissia japonica]